ncbi:MAG: hypothetical protein K8R49_09155 [Candidatus Cloacimonetes bacterium]|nr:hypothetical protein [Candidatus Cloacimonadota bacterium]
MFKKVIPILIILFFIGCSIPDEFGIPSWTTQFRLIFLHDTYDAEAIADTVGSFVANGDTLQFLESTEDFQTIGDIEIADTEVKTTDFVLGDFVPPEIAALNGLPVSNLPNYPDITIPFGIIKAFDPFDEYEEIKFMEGFLELTITNNTVFWMGDAEDGNPLVINVLDGSGETLVGNVVFPNIAPEGGIGSQMIDLQTGEPFPNTIQLELTGQGDVTENATAIIDTSAAIQLGIQIIDIQADWVTQAHIPSQEIEIISGYIEADLPQPEIVNEDSFVFNGYSAIIFNIVSPAPALAVFELVSKKSGVEVPLVHNEGEPININISEGLTEFMLTSENYNINEMLQIIPDGFDYEFNTLIGDNTVIDSLNYADSIGVDIEIVADVQICTFEEEGIWIIPLDNGEIEINEEDVADFDETIYDAFKYGKVIFKYWNTSGMELGFDLLVSDDSTNVLEEIFNFENPDTTKVQMFRIPLMEETTDSTYGEYELNITQDKLDFFLADSVYIVPRINISSQGAQPWTGGITIQGDLSIEVFISSELFED